MKFRFETPVEFSEALVGWDVEFSQLDTGLFSVERDYTRLTHAIVDRTRIGRRLFRAGCTPELGPTFVFRVSTAGTATWWHRQLGPNDIAIFPEDRAYEGLSTPGFDVVSLTFDEDYLLSVAELFDSRVGQEINPQSGLVINCPPEQMQRLRKLVFFMLNNQYSSSDGNIGQMHLATALLESIRGASYKPFKSPRKRDLAFQAALKLIYEAEAEPPNLSDIHQTVGASERTLRTAFQENLGMSITRFINTVKLNRVRESLISHSPESATVAELASAQGFWHASDFTQNYKDMFGELPSLTLRRKHE